MNLFDGVRLLSDDEIIFQIAVFKHINVANVAKQKGNKVINVFAGIANSVSRTIGYEDVMKHEVVNLQKKISVERENLQKISKNELVKILKSEICLRCGIKLESVDEHEIIHSMSEEKLSALLCTCAAKNYNIDRYETSYNKIKNISIYYNEDFLSNLHKRLCEQKEEEIIISDEKIQKALDKIPIEEKRFLQQKIFPKEFSGRGIGRVLRLEKKSKYLSIAGSVLGWETFDIVSVIVNVTMSGLIKLNKVSDSLVAEFIWKIYNKNEEMFSFDMRKLPSYMQPEKRQKIIDEELELRKMLKMRFEFDDILKKNNSMINKNVQEKEVLIKKREEAYKALENYKRKFNLLDRKKEGYIKGWYDSASTKKFYADVNELNSNINECEGIISDSNLRINDLENDLIYLNEEHENIIKNNEKSIVESNIKLAQYTRDLKEKWKEHYEKLSFKEEVFGKTVLAFTLDEVEFIEMMLEEFMSCTDCNALDNENGIILCNIKKTGSGLARIIHEGFNVVDIERYK